MSVRNNFRYTFYASYAGYFVQAIINNFLPLLFLTLQKSFFLSYDKISLLIIINFGVQLLVDMLSASFIDKIGYRASALLAHFFAFAGLFGLGIFPYILPPYAGIILSIIIYATGSGLIEVIISPLVEACPSESKSGSMSLLHSFYCWGQMSVVLLSTLFFTVFSVESWRYLAFLWSIIPLLNSIFFSLVPIPDTLSADNGMKIKELFRTKLFYIFALIMLCSGASELAMSQWASAFAESGLNVSKTVGDLLGPCLFALLMGSARVLFSKVSEKISLAKVMTASSILCIVSYLTASLSPYPLLSLFGCALCGLAVGIMWPGTFSLAAGKIPTGGTAMFAFLALFGDMGCSVGPALVGRTITLTGGNMSNGIFMGTFFPLLLICGLTLMKKAEKKNKENKAME
ncbi:MAG: MFS transporter [Clostridia bacterium]|nr:MFS transporter [Clostridia bacterium]